MEAVFDRQRPEIGIIRHAQLLDVVEQALRLVPRQFPADDDRMKITVIVIGLMQLEIDVIPCRLMFAERDPSLRYAFRGCDNHGPAMIFAGHRLGAAETKASAISRAAKG